MTDSSEQTSLPASGQTSAVRPAPSSSSRRSTFKYVPDPMTEEARRQMREDFARIERAAWSLVGALIVLALFLFFARDAKADVITEIGGGWKLNGTTSLVLQPNCHSAVIYETRPVDPGRNDGLTSCGGDNPLFVGWPIAYQTPDARFRIGWFHMSHWFDGGRDRETHLDCLCASWTFNWTERGRRRDTFHF